MLQCQAMVLIHVSMPDRHELRAGGSPRSRGTSLSTRCDLMDHWTNKARYEQQCIDAGVAPSKLDGRTWRAKTVKAEEEQE